MIDRRRFLAVTALALFEACRVRSRSAPTQRLSLASPLASPVCLPVSGAKKRRVDPLHPGTLARFVDPLPIPRVLAPEGTRPDPEEPSVLVPHYRIAMQAADVTVHRDLPPTRMWTYGGSMPGPTIEVRSGHGASIEWVNDLPARHFLPVDPNLCGATTGAAKGAEERPEERPEVRTVVHVHNARVPPESDGYPEAWFPPGHSSVCRYPNRQDAATLWYHDHAMGLERLNQYAGLFGLYLVRDDVEDALDLPRGPYEIPLLLCDRLFDASGQLVYPTSAMPDAPWVSEVNGDAFLVNGKLFPFLDVEPRRYRFRVVNASNSRFYYLSLGSGETLVQIGSDQGLLPAPAAQKIVTLAPGERADLVIDFREAAGQEIVLKSQAFELMQFRVAARGATKSATKSAPVPSTLRPIAKLAPIAAVKTRTLTLDEYQDRGRG